MICAALGMHVMYEAWIWKQQGMWLGAIFLPWVVGIDQSKNRVDKPPVTHTHTHTHAHTHTHTPSSHSLCKLTHSKFLRSYELMSLCASAEGCMRALLGHELPQLDSSAVDRPPQAAAVASMEKTIAYHSESHLSACMGWLTDEYSICDKLRLLALA